MNDAAIFKAIVPEPWQVLGLRLLPFSIGHSILLHRFDSVFAGGKPNPNPFTDLALGVLICSRTYEQGLSDLFDPGLPKELARWEKRVAGATWFRKGEPINIGERWRMFEHYLYDGEWTPLFQRDEIRTRRVRLPFVQTVRVKIQQAFGLNDSEIMNRSWALCKADYFTLMDHEGLLTIWDDDAQNELARIRAQAQNVQERLKAGKMVVNW